MNKNSTINSFKQITDDATEAKSDEPCKQKLIKNNKILQNAIHWALVNGFVIVPRKLTPEDEMCVTYLPFTLYPTPYYREHYEKVSNLQPHFNEIIYKIANSETLMNDIFKSVKANDHFISSLWNIYQKSLKEGYNQKIQLSILRVDYMLHQQDKYSETKIKQVEINTIAAGLGYGSTKMTNLHKKILNWSNYDYMISELPKNEPIKTIGRGFVEAWRLYNVQNAIILFIVLDWETNLADQRHHEYEITMQEPNIEIQRCTLAEMNSFGNIDENKVLYYDTKEVALVYFRAAYSPEHFKTDNEWNALTMIELSKAIKVPNVATYLSGMKKTQEYLYHEHSCLKQLCNNDIVLYESIRSVFAEFLKLENKDDFERILKNPNDFVLKPQREGGGNNYYNSDVKKMLMSMLDDEKEIDENEKEDITKKDRYVVMELLKPIVTENVMVTPSLQQKLANKENKLEYSKINSELGIFGVQLKNNNETIINESCGYLLRSKLIENMEGGVHSGAGALDSIFFMN